MRRCRIVCVDMSTQRIPSPSPYAANVGFSASARAGGLVATAGQTAVAADGTVVGGDDPYAQTVEALRKVVAALADAGAAPADVIQTRMYVTAREHWEAVGRAHGEVFAETRPAATMVVCDLLDERMLVEVEALAFVPG